MTTNPLVRDAFVAGVVMAPIVYAFVKRELRERGSSKESL